MALCRKNDIMECKYLQHRVPVRINFCFERTGKNLQSSCVYIGFCWALLLLLSVVCSEPVCAEARLAWQANSSSQQVTGYYIYYRVEEKRSESVIIDYDNASSIDAEDVLASYTEDNGTVSCSLSELIDEIASLEGITVETDLYRYAFKLKAYTDDNMTSAFSCEAITDSIYYLEYDMNQPPLFLMSGTLSSFSFTEDGDNFVLFQFPGLNMVSNQTAGFLQQEDTFYAEGSFIFGLMRTPFSLTLKGEGNVSLNDSITGTLTVVNERTGRQVSGTFSGNRVE